MLSENLLKAQSLKQILDSYRPIDKDAEQRIMQKFRLDWNYHSNNLEGNSLSFGETKALILFGITAQGKPLKDHFEIRGHDEAIKWIEEVLHKDVPLTEKFIRELHELLLKEPYEVEAITNDGTPTRKRVEIGRYKTLANHVKTATGEIFYFANPEETPAKMNDLMDWYNGKKDLPDTNPIVLAAEFHYKFIIIHPFDDGNGRVARILMNFILMQNGYPPVIIKTHDKQAYFSALQQADTGNLEAFIEYIAFNTNSSLEIMIRGSRGENIDDIDDIDKEIALLEAELNSLPNKIEQFKSEEVVVGLFKKTIEPFINTFFDGSLKMKKFYLVSDISVYHINSSVEIALQSDMFLIDRASNSGFSYEYIYANINFAKLRLSGHESLEFSSKIFFDLKEASYTIYGQDNHNNMIVSLEKLYHNEITIEEMNSFCNKIVRSHMDFIRALQK